MAKTISRLGRIVGAVLLAGSLSGSAALALTSADRAAVRDVITRQIDAFRADDATAAYAFAAPTIKELFPSAEVFMDMVRSKYLPVYRPQSVTFGESLETANGALQKVYLTGPDRGHWLATYTAERQPDGNWRITGCALTADGSKDI